MSLAEWVSRRLPEGLKNRPLKAKSLAQFMALVKREGGESIEVRARIRGKMARLKGTRGFSACFESRTIVSSQTLNGREISYTKKHGSILSPFGLSDARKRDEADRLGIVNAEHLCEEIKSGLPDVEVVFTEGVARHFTIEPYPARK